MGDTWSPCWAASATKGPAMVNDNSGGITVTRAKVNDRKISTSSTMMNSSDRPWILLPVLPEAFCWSTCAAISPARCACSPAGRWAWVILARRPFTRSVA